MDSYDLIVIGGGAGGMSAAETAARRDAHVALVQDGPVGGDCTFTGCVPSKSLIAAAAAGLGLPGALARARSAVQTVAATEDASVMRGRGIDVVEGRATFVEPKVIEVDGRRLRSDRFVVGTGARPVVPPIEGLRDAAPLTSDTFWDHDGSMRSLAVLGGGPIGIELAQAVARTGVEVTVFEAEDRILGREEPRTADLIADRLRAEGVGLRLGARVSAVHRKDGAVHVEAGDGAPVVADEVLVAIGRSPVTDGLDVETAGISLDDRGHVITDRFLTTSADGVYAIGDVTGRMPFTHAAYAMGRIAANNALSRFRWRLFSDRAIPWVTFTSPEIGRVGLTEADAHEAYGSDATVVELDLAHLDRAIAEEHTDGYVKLIAAPRRVLRGTAGGIFVGATVVAPRAGEMVQEIATSIASFGFPARVALTTHAYPTWSMAIQQAAAGFFMEIPGATTRPARAGSPSE